MINDVWLAVEVMDKMLKKRNLPRIDLKKYREIFDFPVTELNLNPQDVLLIGDTIHDYDVSKHMGCDCLLIANGHNSYGRLAKLGIYVVSTLKEIIQV